jgi:hypothetical protein
MTARLFRIGRWHSLWNQFRHFARVPRYGRFPTRLRRSRIGASQGRINVRQCVKDIHPVAGVYANNPRCSSVPLNI